MVGGTHRDDIGDGSGDFSFAKKALKGIKGGDAAKKPPAGEPAREPPGELTNDMLQKLVDAFKRAPGAISAVEPDGYGYLVRVRTGDPIAPGARGDAVEALQRALRKAGTDVAMSGRYDAATESAVRDFQQKNGLVPDGVFGPSTLDALDAALGLSTADEDSSSSPNAEADEVPRSGASASALPTTGNAFVDKLVPGAVKGMHLHGVPASVLIAMAILESEWGERMLARDYNNVFGVRGTGPAGSVMMAVDEDEQATKPAGNGIAFKKYDSAADSVTDFARIFATADAYKGVMSHRGRAENFALALSGAYSANPRYGELVVRIMKQFDLARFDRIQPPSGGYPED